MPDFFKSLNGLTAVFSRSSKRVHELQQFISRKLPSVAPTRWNFTSRITKAVFKHRTQLIELFESILDNSDCWDSDTLIKSRGFLRFLNKSEAIWLLEVFSKLFSYTDVLYNVLQSKMYDVCIVLIKLKSFFAICNTNEIMDLMEYGLQLSSVKITQSVSVNVKGEIAMKATRKLTAPPYFLRL